MLQDERLAENAAQLGELLRSELRAIGSPLVHSVRGKGLLNAIVVNERPGASAWDVCVKLRDNGLLVSRNPLTGSSIPPIADHVLLTAIAVNERLGQSAWDGSV